MAERPPSQQQQKLTDEEIDFLKVAFNQIDKNQDGIIDARELGRLLSRLNMKATERQLDAMMAAQRDPSSKHPQDCLDFNRFVAMMERSKQLLPVDFDSEARQLFAVIDRNNDGRISKAELRETMLAVNLRLTNQELDNMFNAADLNKDGYITFDEFRPMVKLLQKTSLKVKKPGAAATKSPATPQKPHQLKEQNKQPGEKLAKQATASEKRSEATDSATGQRIKSSESDSSFTGQS